MALHVNDFTNPTILAHWVIEFDVDIQHEAYHLLIPVLFLSLKLSASQSSRHTLITFRIDDAYCVGQSSHQANTQLSTLSSLVYIDRHMQAIPQQN